MPSFSSIVTNSINFFFILRTQIDHFVRNILCVSEETKKPEFAGGVTLEDGRCGGQWRYPRNCSPENGTCEYAIEWTYKGKKVICLIFFLDVFAFVRESEQSPPPLSMKSWKFFSLGSDNVRHFHDEYQYVDRSWIFR